MYWQQSDLKIDKYWNELLQVLTEDENLRIRKHDFNELKRSDVVEFFTNVKYFEERIEQRMEQINKIRNNGNS